MWRNWGGSVRVRPHAVAQPGCVDEVVAVVDDARARGLRVKAIGSAHSFTGIAVATGVRMEPSGLTGLPALDPLTRRARFAAGTTLREAGVLLSRHRLALENVGDIDGQTIGGAISTGTHGTDALFGGLVTRVAWLSLVTAAGEMPRIGDTGAGRAENRELLPAAAIGLGALGVLVDVTVRCVPTFLVHSVERPEPLEEILEQFAWRAQVVDHFELFWFPHTEVVLTKTNTRLRGDAVAQPLGVAGAFFEGRVIANTVFRLSCGISRLLPALTPGINRLLICRRHGGRPHWGKHHFLDAAAPAESYPRHADFVALRDRLDPDRMSTNPYLEKVLGR